MLFALTDILTFYDTQKIWLPTATVVKHSGMQYTKMYDGTNDMTPTHQQNRMVNVCTCSGMRD